MKVILIHQYDPFIHNVGGIGTFIQTFIKYSPPDMDVDLVGVTSDPEKSPLGRWQAAKSGDKTYRFLPIVNAHPIQRGRVPVNLQLTWALRKYRKMLDLRNAILEMHRIEPALVLRDLKNPKVLFLHAHSMDLYNPKTEVVWKHFPWLYFQMEKFLIRKMGRIFIVREDAMEFYQKQYPALASRISFLPTWSDDEIFVSHPEEERKRIKEELAREHGFSGTRRLLLFVGRFEGQKDPRLLLESFKLVARNHQDVDLVMIGEGLLEGEIRAFIEQNNLSNKVRLLGPQPQIQISRWMNASDFLVLSSAFEGMPRVVVESLQCGLPVVSTEAGEAQMLLRNSRAGRLVAERTPEAFSRGIEEQLQSEPDRRACQERVETYTAGKVLEKVYTAYRELLKPEISR